MVIIAMLYLGTQRYYLSLYEIRIVARDLVDLIGTDTVGQITIDNVVPEILEYTDNLLVELGTSNNNLLFNVSDFNPHVYSVYKDGIFQYNDSWLDKQSIVVNLDGLGIGDYYYYLVLSDTLGNYVISEQILVAVEDTTAPIVTQSNDVIYEVGSIENSIKWIATDLRPWSYSIYINSTHQFDHTWVSGELIELDIDGLSVGVYVYKIEFYDLFGNMAFDEVLVTVEEDDTQPNVVEQDNFTYELGTSGNDIVWKAFDFNPSTYNLYLDGNLFDSDTWTNETSITVNIDGLDLGTHLYRIEFYDLFGNMGYDEVNVTVIDTIMPELIEQPDITYEEGSIGNEIVWTATDMKSADYYLYINGSLDETGLWTSSEQLIFNIDGLEPGKYNYTIVFFDTSGNCASDEVLITVTDTTTDSSVGYGFTIVFAAVGLVLSMKRKKKIN